jgi:tRNA pseudouridine55 synthase
LRRKLGVRKMGHAGTLDPLATGLLIVGIGDATKGLSQLIGLPKTYEAEILLGVRTDSADADGKVIEQSVVPELSSGEVEKALASMIGALDLAVPAYSAIKRGGRPLYDYARKGEVMEAPIKQMIVRDAKLISYGAPIVRAVFDVSSGTYIRSLAHELARRLGTIGTIQNLRRLSIGDYKIEDAKKLEDL